MTATPPAGGLDSGQQSRYSESGKSPSMTAMTHRKPGEDESPGFHLLGGGALLHQKGLGKKADAAGLRPVKESGGRLRYSTE